MKKKLSNFLKKYPDILFMDKAGVTNFYVVDKFLTNSLIRKKFSNFQPSWYLVSKVYKTCLEKSLADKIRKETPAEMYFIQPLFSWGGRGILIVENSKLESILEIILKDSHQKNKNLTNKYCYGSTDPFFLVEKHEQSKFIEIDSKKQRFPFRISSGLILFQIR